MYCQSQKEQGTKSKTMGEAGQAEGEKSNKITTIQKYLQEIAGGGNGRPGYHWLIVWPSSMGGGLLQPHFLGDSPRYECTLWLAGWCTRKTN